MRRRDYKTNSLKDTACSDIRHQLFKCIESQNLANKNDHTCIELYNNLYLKCINEISPTRVTSVNN